MEWVCQDGCAVLTCLCFLLRNPLTTSHLASLPERHYHFLARTVAVLRSLNVANFFRWLRPSLLLPPYSPVFHKKWQQWKYTCSGKNIGWIALDSVLMQGLTQTCQLHGFAGTSISHRRFNKRNSWVGNTGCAEESFPIEGVVIRPVCLTTGQIFLFAWMSTCSPGDCTCVHPLL